MQNLVAVCHTVWA